MRHFHEVALIVEKIPAVANEIFEKHPAAFQNLQEAFLPMINFQH